MVRTRYAKPKQNINNMGLKKHHHDAAYNPQSNTILVQIIPQVLYSFKLKEQSLTMNGELSINFSQPNKWLIANSKGTKPVHPRN
jgi:hypothetical protein